MMKKLSIALLAVFVMLISPLAIVAQESKPPISSDYVYLLDTDSGQVMWNQGGEDIIYPASMTKIMTLILAIEKCTDVNKKIMIDEASMATLKESNASRAGFDIGDEVSVLDLFYGALLPSGAECSQALAIESAGSISNFVALMNQKANELGMVNTKYVNVTGLHHPNHVSTLKDISVLLTYCLKNPLFKEIFSSKQHLSSPTKNYPSGLLMDSTVFSFINNPSKPYNVNFDGLVGAKSGYTTEARYCLASIGEYKGNHYMLITAHAWQERKIPSHIIDATTIYSYYFKNYDKKALFHQGDVIQTSKIMYSFAVSELQWKMPSDIILNVPISSDAVRIVVNIPEVIKAPISIGQEIGVVDVYVYDTLFHQLAITSTIDVKQSKFLVVISTIWLFIVKYKILFIFIFVILILMSIIARIQRIKRRRRRKKRKVSVKIN